jgi:hypothetical protein
MRAMPGVLQLVAVLQLDVATQNGWVKPAIRVCSGAATPRFGLILISCF